MHNNSHTDGNVRAPLPHVLKALIIGLDGATWRVLTPLLEAGHLPRLQAALRRGVAGTLLSTIPPVTALAWPTFATGNNPGRHGLLSWQAPLNERFERPFQSAHQVRGAKLWTLAGEAGLRVCIFNVPITYPPEMVNGVMVGGLLTPDTNAPFVYPPQLRPELLAAFPDYQVDIDGMHIERQLARAPQVQAFLQETIAVTATRGAAFRWLLDRERPDLAMIVFELTDRIQHLLWKYIAALPDAREPSEMAQAAQVGLLRCFAALDDEIGRLMAYVGDESYLLFLSDHGFGPIETMVHLNHWLAAQGWLRFDSTRAGRREALRRLGRVVKRWLPPSLMRRARASFSVLQTIDWTQTCAYAGLPGEYGIFLNLRGREPAGIVTADEYEALRSQIIDALRAWTDARTGAPIVRAVYRREELYHGPYVQQAPDIIMELAAGYHIAYLPYQGDILQDVTALPWGFHEREGIFGLSGPGVVRSSENTQTHMADLMPSLLYALGLPVPAGVDGEVHAEFFDPAWRRNHPLRRQEEVDKHETAPVAAAYSADEEARLAERMKGLGYLN
jgi:predicted AlkP superfamily phosphohydrolase/phosphomutase